MGNKKTKDTMTQILNKPLEALFSLWSLTKTTMSDM